MRRWRWLLAAVLAGSASGAVMASEDEVVRRWEFKTADDAAGWEAGGDARDMTVADGVLRFTMVGADAYVFAPAVNVPLDGCLIRVRMRCAHAGVSQLYWTTSDRPEFSEQQVLAVPAPAQAAPPPEFATWEFPIGHPRDQGRALTRFRIDPYNNSGPGTVEIASVELVRQATVLDVNFSLAAHWVGVGEPVAVRVVMRHVDGRAPAGRFDVTFSDGRKAKVVPSAFTPPGPPLVRGGSGGPAAQSDQEHAGLTTPVEFKFDRPGVHQIRATIAATDGKVLYDLETSIIVGGRNTPFAAPAISSGDMRVDLIPLAGSELVGAARWSVPDAAHEWRLAGWLMPLAEFTVRTSDGRIIRRQPALDFNPQAGPGLPLTVDVAESEMAARIDVDHRLGRSRGHGTLDITARLRATKDLALLGFSGPVLLVDRDPPGDLLNRFALFGGLEFLEPGWASSSDRAVGDRFAERWSPAPHKVTLPVMAVEAQALTTALVWKPRPGTGELASIPVATFASPNSVDGQANHLFKLALPGGEPWREENERQARRPLTLPAGKAASLAYTLRTEPDLPVALVARGWYEQFGFTSLPARPHDDAATYDLIARCYGETMWWPEGRGWRHHWYLEEPTARIPDIAAELIAHAVKTGDPQWVEKTGLAGQNIIDAAVPLERRILDDGHARNMLAAMRPDGTWPFKNTPELRERVRQFTDGQYDSLGEDDSTSLGTCVQAALPILRYAELSGDSKCLAAGLKALAAMRQFRVPRGAQVWEVHQDIPDIRAAALAVEAYQLGYRLTGDKQYLQDASYWAWTGVPFIYSWKVPVNRTPGNMIASRDKHDPQRVQMPLSEGFEQPRREIMPYATVPVMGPTFYVINWFGVVVQWCGLEWAEKVITLDADVPDPMLRYIADGVVNSGLQQMFDQPPWVGLYPDVWDVQQNIAQGALIYPNLPLRCLQAQGRAPLWTMVWTRVLRDPAGGPAWHVSGWGKPPEQLAAPSNVAWSVRLAYPAGQANELLIAGATKPRRVRVGDAVLKARADTAKPPAAADTGGAPTAEWHYMGDRKALVVRFISPANGEADVQVAW